MPGIKPFFYALLALTGATSAVADDFPYTAYIAADKTEIVAGPGHRFYATDRLARATKVEIYREEASGWLAIRPPEGSFSWAPAEFVERLDDQSVGSVKQTTGAWVGTNVEHVSEHHQQVTLKAGELVQVLSEKTVTAEGGKERVWFKIAPPAGEYRWVHLRDVVRQKPEELPPPVEPIAEEKSREAAEPEASAISERSTNFDRRVEPAQFRNTASSSSSKTGSSDGFVARKRRENDQGSTSGNASFPAPTSSPARPNLEPGARFAAATSRPSTASSSTYARGLSSDEISRQLDEVEVDLSLMLAKDRSQWNLSALKQRVEGLVESGADPVARGRARLVLDKIKQFENAFDSRSSPNAAGKLAASSAADQPPAAPGSLADPRYDAQGWLKPVVSKKSDKPIAPFAVVDSEGKPVCFISPSPGLNLNRYLNKQVGLYGRRGYLEELKKPHVVAERVIELDNHLR